MLIRDQDKTAIVNCDNVRGIYYQEVEIREKIVYKVTADNFLLGFYSTEEKAIKVLDMIVNTYVESVWTDSQTIIANRVCFEMPMDNEVEV